MQISTQSITFNTQGHNHILDITHEIQRVLDDTEFREGNVLISAVGSTTGITTLEFEPGLVHHDVSELFEDLMPYGKDYKHNQTWGDDNGSAHLRSALVGTSQVIPFYDGQLILGTWQQIVFMDFDTRPRQRRVVVQLTGE